MLVTPADPPAVTVPVLAGLLGRSLWDLTRMLRDRPDLAGRIFRAGRCRMVRAEDIPAFRAALGKEKR